MREVVQKQRALLDALGKIADRKHQSATSGIKLLPRVLTKNGLSDSHCRQSYATLCFSAVGEAIQFSCCQEYLMWTHIALRIAVPSVFRTVRRRALFFEIKKFRCRLERMGSLPWCMS